MSDKMLEIEIIGGAVEGCLSDCLVVGLFEEGEIHPSPARCGEKLSQEIQRLQEGKWIAGKAGESLLVPWKKGDKAIRLLLLGLGKREKFTREAMRALGARLTDFCHKAGIRSACSLLTLDKIGKLSRRHLAMAMAEGAWLGDYRFDAYRSDPEAKEASKKNLGQLTLMVRKNEEESTRQRVTKSQCIVRGVYLARDLSNQPANHLSPKQLAQAAKELAHRLPIKTTVLDEKELAEEGMNGILAVGQGSANPPRLIIMEYRKGGDKHPLVVVGKGITFDSGGISLKPGAGMEEMKFDMSGGSAVIGFMQAVAELNWPINVVGLVPAAENMPSGTAQRPGDVIKTAKGLYVEVINTDAEGRLILCDALHYAERFDPSVIIDLATLTGACVVALGAQAAGMMGNNANIQKALRKVGEEVGERVWPLPLFDEYQEQLKSQVADIKNVGNPGAGAITAACFLSRFIGKDRRWVHLDIAGVARDMDGKRPHIPKGATGFGVRLLCAFVEEHLI